MTLKSSLPILFFLSILMSTACQTVVEKEHFIRRSFVFPEIEGKKSDEVISLIKKSVGKGPATDPEVFPFIEEQLANSLGFQKGEMTFTKYEVIIKPNALNGPVRLAVTIEVSSNSASLIRPKKGKPFFNASILWQSHWRLESKFSGKTIEESIEMVEKALADAVTSYYSMKIRQIGGKPELTRL